jgi:hypothetical protein
MPYHRPVAGLGARAALMLLILFIAGCGGTKVMTAQKSIVFEDRIYNVGAVQEVRPVREIILPDGVVRDLSGMNDRELRNLFETHDRLRVRFSVMFDERELEYAAGTVDSARRVERIRRQFDSAMDQIRRFLANRKRTQLDLS